MFPNNLSEFPVSCNKDCGAGCPLTAHIDTGKLKKITLNKSAPKYVTGCYRGYSFDKVLYSDRRVLTPLIRSGERGSGEFRKASWEEAIDKIAEKLKEEKEKNGSDSIMVLGGSGSCRGAVHNTVCLSMRFARIFGPCVERHSTYSYAAANYVTPYILGNNNCGIDPQTLKDSKLIILWGANILDTRFGAELENVLIDLKKSGTPIIVIDPRNTRTVKALASQWIQIYPGTDSSMMAAIAYYLINNELIDLEFIKKYSVGFESYKDYILGNIDGVKKDSKYAEKICGVKSKIIEDLAKEYGSTKPTALIPGLSIQRTMYGEDAIRNSITLQTITANIGKIGGSSGGNIWGTLPRVRCQYIPVPSVPNLKSVPIHEWADYVLGLKNYENRKQPKIIYNIGNNYLLQGSDINKNIKAFKSVDFIITQDVFMTDTARFSDVILPTTMWPERNDIIFPTDYKYLYYSHKVVSPPKSVKDDYDIFCEIAKKLGSYNDFSQGKSSDEWIDEILSKSEVKDIETFKKTGIYNSERDGEIAFSGFIENPNNFPLSTPSGKIEIESKKYNVETGHSSIPKTITLLPSNNHPLRLITPHSKYLVNSSNQNIEHYKKLDSFSALMNKIDAENRSIKNGELIKIYNEIGEITIRVDTSSEIMQGVVSIDQGIWLTYDNTNIQNEAKVNSSANLLTPNISTMPSQGTRTHSVFVEIKKIST